MSLKLSWDFLWSRLLAQEPRPKAAKRRREAWLAVSRKMRACDRVMRAGYSVGGPPTLDWVRVFFVLFVHRRMRSRVRPCWNVALTGRVLVYPKEPAAGNKDVAASKKPEVL